MQKIFSMGAQLILPDGCVGKSVPFATWDRAFTPSGSVSVLQEG
jgi:hypothetical protein